MAVLLKGKPVADAINEKTRAAAEALRDRGIVPTLAIVRVGEREDDLSYERGACKRCAGVGVETRVCALPADVDAEVFYQTLQTLNADAGVHGILMMRPLPEQIDEKKACEMILPEKDVDGCTSSSMAGVFMNSGVGFAPCTAQAVVEMLDYYAISPKGKHAVILGRSLVIGRPAAMLLMHRQATPTICHTRTLAAAKLAQEADILVVSTGQMESVGRDYLKAGQIVIDVGIHWNAKKEKLCGDVLTEEAEDIVTAISPVPGGVGSVTTSVLAAHVVEAAQRSSN